MEYRSLGKSGLKISELSLGSWITFGTDLGLKEIKNCLKIAYDAGVNFFDNAESYGNGASELLMGEALRDFKREELVISTKIYWGGDGPNATGLSRKHLYEGIRNSLRRLQQTYVDLLFCHRPDPMTPIEETVRAMDAIIREGLALYWGTSEWSVKEIQEAYQIAEEIGAVPPTMEQPEYNMFNRKKMEKEFKLLYKKYGLGTTIWSPLNSGILTGKYNEGIPSDSRLAKNEWLQKTLTKEKISRVKQLELVAKDLNCTLSQLALAWCLKNPNVSTVITGSAHPDQILENLFAGEVKNRLDHVVMKRIEEILTASTPE